MPFKYNALLGLGLDDTIPLDGAGKIPATYLPSYVDDVEEYNNLAAFPATGETGKIYVAKDTGFVYRWSGSVYVQIGVTSAGGSDTQVQFNDGGVFGGDSGLVFNKTTNKLTAGGDVELNDGGSFTTTLQTVTPTANRTISFPDATGTVGLVAGSSGQLVYNNAGAYAGVPSSVVGASGNVTLNAASGFTGNLLDLQVNGSSRFKVSNGGVISFGSSGTKTLTQSSTVVTLSDSVDAYAIFASYIVRDSNSRVALGSVDISLTGATDLGIALGAVSGIGWTTSTASSGTVDLRLHRDAANTLAQRNGTNAQTFRVYNTFTSSTNYELGKLEWASNVFRIGTEKGSGGGTARTVEVHTDSISRLALDTTGSVRVVTALTVATLPGTPAVGMIARVTDATAPAVGSTVTGGGAAAALCWYNGANWSVIGV
jgi:hypothetical protein